MAMASIPAFSPLGSEYAHDQLTPLEAQNMPRIASQDGLGICYACVAATMMQSENCRATKPSVGCENLPKSQLFSQLDLTRIVPPSPGNEIHTARSSYEGLKIEGDGTGGNPHATAIIAALYTTRVANEACLDLATIVNKMTSRNESVKLQEAMWERMKGSFKKAKEKGCQTCLDDAYATAKQELKENLNLNVSHEELLSAFAVDTYDKFLDKLTGASKCTSNEQNAFFRPYKKVTYEQFPKKFEPDRKKMEQMFIEKSKEVLQQGRPLALTGICIGTESAESCQSANRHASVIAGYRRICNKEKENMPGAKCRDVFKVVNCWGESWQQENNGGWVDASTLLRHTEIQPGVLGYFADK